MPIPLVVSKEVRRSTGHIMATIRYSIQQGSKSRQNPCQVQPTESIGNLSASRRCIWVRSTVSTVWSPVQPTKSSKVIQKKISLGVLNEDKLCNTLQAMAPTNVKTVHQTCLLHIGSNLDRLGLLPPTHGQHSQQQSGQITLQSVLINESPSFSRPHIIQK